MSKKKNQVNFVVPAEEGNEETQEAPQEAPQEERRQWRGKIEFILTIVGFAVGLGNVWRFPYLCFKNGGGAFLIPYFLMLIVLGLPVFFLELSIGQFSSLSCIALFERLSPLFKGLGWGMIIVNIYILTYYTVVVAWSIHYLYSSLASIPSGILPWSFCDQLWATVNCTNVTNLPGSSTVVKLSKLSTTPSQEYFYNYVLAKSDGMLHEFYPKLDLTICFMLAWLFILLFILKGVSSLGKVAYVTSTLPYIFITILIIKGSLMPGALQGIIFYLKPNFELLKNPTVWYEAAVQIFYSLGLCNGALISLASFNQFRNNCLRDAVLVSVVNCMTSLYAGFAVFAVLGYMADRSGMDISKVVDKGPGLAFIAYPDALATMPVPHLWSTLFFLMMISLGFGSLLGGAEATMSSIMDEFPILHTSRRLRLPNAIFGRQLPDIVIPGEILFRCAFCFSLFLLGLPMVTHAGYYWFNLMENFVGGFPLLFFALMELLLISTVYGFERVSKDITMMIGKKPNLYFKITWKGLSVGVVVFIFIFSIHSYQSPRLDNFNYPGWALTIGWLTAFSSMIMVPLFALKVYFRESGLWDQLVNLASPRGDWGPAETTLVALQAEAVEAAEAAEATQSAEVATKQEEEEEQESSLPKTDDRGWLNGSPNGTTTQTDVKVHYRKNGPPSSQVNMTFEME